MAPTGSRSRSRSRSHGHVDRALRARQLRRFHKYLVEKCPYKRDAIKEFTDEVMTQLDFFIDGADWETAPDGEVDWEKNWLHKERSLPSQLRHIKRWYAEMADNSAAPEQQRESDEGVVGADPAEPVVPRAEPHSAADSEPHPAAKPDTHHGTIGPTSGVPTEFAGIQMHQNVNANIHQAHMPPISNMQPTVPTPAQSSTRPFILPNLPKASTHGPLAFRSTIPTTGTTTRSVPGSFEASDHNNKDKGGKGDRDDENDEWLEEPDIAGLEPEVARELKEMRAKQRQVQQAYNQLPAEFLDRIRHRKKVSLCHRELDDVAKQLDQADRMTADRRADFEVRRREFKDAKRRAVIARRQSSGLLPRVGGDEDSDVRESAERLRRAHDLWVEALKENWVRYEAHRQASRATQVAEAEENEALDQWDRFMQSGG